MPFFMTGDSQRTSEPERIWNWMLPSPWTSSSTPQAPVSTLWAGIVEMGIIDTACVPMPSLYFFPAMLRGFPSTERFRFVSPTFWRLMTRSLSVTTGP